MMEKKNKSKIIGLAVMAVVFFLMLFCMLGCGFAGSGDSGKGNKDKLELTNVDMSVSYNEYLGYSVKITGIAKNVSGRNLSYASVEFSVYDTSGNNLGTALDNINHLGNGDTWSFEATLLSFQRNRTLGNWLKLLLGKHACPSTRKGFFKFCSIIG